MSTFEEKQAQRFRLMNVMYKLTDGDTSIALHLSKVAAAVGLPEPEADLIAQYLVDRGLLKFVTFGPTLSITPRGVDEVERAHAQPKQPTPNFGVINNYMHIETMSGGQVQQGNVGSTQEMNLSSDDTQAVLAWLIAIRHAEISGEARAQANMQIEIIEAEVKSASPAVRVMRAAAAVLLGILNGVGTAGAIELAKHIPQVLHG